MGRSTARALAVGLVAPLAMLLALGAGARAGEAPRGKSAWVASDAMGKLTYKTLPAGDRIMDFSYAGYRGGGVALPEVAAARTVKPSGGDDDTGTIQAAVDEVAKLPVKDGQRGAVLLGPGVYPCARTITLAADGVVLRGSGAAGPGRSTIKLTGQPHLAIAVRAPRETQDRGMDPREVVQTRVADGYMPSGTMGFSVANASGLAVGDTILIRRPVTAAWVKFMGMDDLVRDGRPQTWIRAGSVTSAERRVAAVAGNKITLDVPLSDSLDAKYLDPPGATVVKIRPPVRVAQVGVENLHIEAPPQAISHTQPHFTALRISGQDCWARDLVIEETMNSVGVSGWRITLQRVAVNRKALHQGSSRPAEFAPNGGQVLLDRCTSKADNVWYVATGGGQAGPIVILNCTFEGNGRAESHQRWSTGMLYDNCRVPGGGIEFRNRGTMGSGHGWSMGWGVAWNCVAESYLVQNPPGAANWMIGCVGASKVAARPGGPAANLPEGIKDSPGVAVAPQSLYLAQLKERLGAGALKAIGY